MLASHDRIDELAFALRRVASFLWAAEALVVEAGPGAVVVVTVTVLVGCVSPQALSPHAARAAAMTHPIRKCVDIQLRR
jgi:hypothetical protein